MSLLFSSCIKKADYSQVKVLGHATMGLNILNSVYHDNSKEAFELALSIEGCEGVEIDVQVSKDGNLWLYHDVNLESETNGNGCIGDLNSDELSTFHYTTLAKEELVSIEELDLNFLKGKEIFLDFRHLNDCTGTFVSAETVVSKLIALQLAAPKDFQVNCLLSYDEWIMPFVTAGFTVYYSIYSSDEFSQFNTEYPELAGYVVKNSDFSSNDIEEIKSSNKKVYIFEIRSPKGIRRALKKQPDGVLTDDIRAALIEKN